MAQPTVAIIGASADRRKYGNKAVRAFAAQGYHVFPIHPTAGEIEGHRAYPSAAAVPVERLDRVSLYVPPEIGVQVLDDIAQKTVGELWVNPGAESDELFAKAQRLGLDTVFACSIVGIGVDPGELD
jgi:hypothetical protein